MDCPFGCSDWWCEVLAWRSLVLGMPPKAANNIWDECRGGCVVTMREVGGNDEIGW